MEAWLALAPARAALIGLVLSARVVPIFLIAPFFGGRTLPVWARAGLGLAVAAVLAPALAGQALPMLAPLGTGALLALAFKEALIGVTLGLLVSLPFAAAQAAGGLMTETPRGDDAPGAALFGQLAVVLFLTLDGHHVFLRGLAHAYEVVPVWRPLAAGAPGAILEATLIGGAHLVAVAVALAAPVLAALLLADVALGAVARAAPAAGSGGAQARMLVGAGALLLALGAIVTVLRGELARMLRQVFGILSSL